MKGNTALLATGNAEPQQRRRPRALLPIPQYDGFAARNSKRGPVSDMEVSVGMRQPDGTTPRSRRFNPVEASRALRSLDDKMDSALEKVRERYAQRYLRALRKLLEPYNTSRHEITIIAAMGAGMVCVDGDNVDHKQDRGLYVLLKEIDQALSWDWCAYLDGEHLN